MEIIENELYFSRNTSLNKFVRTTENFAKPKLILRREDKKIFCTTHQCWESAEAVQIKKGLKTETDKVSLCCGKSYDGLLLDIKSTPEHGRYYYYNVDENCMLGKDRVNCDIFGIRIRLNNSKYSPFLIEYSVFDRQKFDDDIKSKNTIYSIPTATVQCCYNLKSVPQYYNHSVYNLGKLPSIVKEYAVRMLWQKYKTELSLNRENPETQNIKKSDTDIIDALVRYPCEPGLIQIDEFLKKENIEIPYNDKNAYFTVCQKLGIKSWKFLREAFEENSKVLILAANLFKCGFKDINIINEILNDRIYSPHIISNWKLYKDDSSILQYLKWALSFHSERSVWTTFKKNMKSYVFEQDFSHITDMNDAFNMFVEYKDDLNPEIIKAIKKDGLNKYNHDVLSKAAQQGINVTFKYSEEQKSLEDEIDGYKFILPEDSYTLNVIGNELHNCVSGYKNSVKGKSCTIIYVTKNSFKVMCIEVRGNKIHQCRENYNNDPQGENKTVFDKWCQKHNLIFTVNQF